MRAPLSVAQGDGARVGRVFLDLLGTTGNAARDMSLRREIGEIVGLSSGDSLNASALRAAESRIQRLAGIDGGRIELYAGSVPGEVVVLVGATLTAEVRSRPARDPAAVFASERSLVRWQLGGSHGVFADHNPWFGTAERFTSGSPIAESPPGPGWAPWAESSLEYGIAAATRLGEAPATLFAEATGLASATLGTDLFQGSPRFRNRVEKGYFGFAWVDRDQSRSLRVSVGRQNWQLHGGFLFSRFAAGSNAGPNPGLYLSPRTAYQRAALIDARAGRLRFEAFDLNPSELEGFDSGSRYQGGHVRWIGSDDMEWGLTGYRVA